VTEPLLAVSDLRVEFAGAGGWRPVVEDVGFTIGRGETLGLIGESGSGKTVSSLAVMGLIPRGNGRVAGGRVEFEGRDLLKLPGEAMRQVRGAQISMIFQEPMTSLNPAFTVGRQICDPLRAHGGVSRGAARRRALEMLDRVGIPDAKRRVDSYPHELSGGMRQRAMIAMALACEPKLLIADEPTTALDVTVQAQILDLMRSLKSELGTAILFVTHDFGVVADICDRVAVMYAGQVVEEASVGDMFARPRHP
jgi:peptide/nickel transport system ATP-binding protein